jgi:hypothetical protein
VGGGVWMMGSGTRGARAEKAQSLVSSIIWERIASIRLHGKTVHGKDKFIEAGGLKVRWQGHVWRTDPKRVQSRCSWRVPLLDRRSTRSAAWNYGYRHDGGISGEAIREHYCCGRRHPVVIEEGPRSAGHWLPL